MLGVQTGIHCDGKLLEEQEDQGNLRLTKQQRGQLRLKFGGRCAYCGCELPEKGWHADHVEPVLREWWKRQPKVSWKIVNGRPVKTEEKQVVGLARPYNDVIDNLFPSCRPCNLDKHCMSLETWRGVVADKVRVLRDNYTAFNHAERFGLVQETKKPVVFWFEQYTDAMPPEAAEN